MVDEPSNFTLRWPPYVGISAACDLLGFKRSKLYELAGQGVIRVVKVGGRSVVDLSHALAWMGSLPPAEITTGLRKSTSSGKPAHGG